MRRRLCRWFAAALGGSLLAAADVLAQPATPAAPELDDQAYKRLSGRNLRRQEFEEETFKQQANPSSSGICR